jgi:hypothetical protein
MSVSASAIGTSATVSEAAAVPVVIQVSIANAPAAPLAYKVSSNGTGVAGATFSWQSSARGQLSVSFPSPAPTGAGTYTGSVQLSVCQDSACTQPISGSPVNLPVIYLVEPPTTFVLNPQAVGYQATTSATSPQTASFQLLVSNVPAGLYVELFQPAKGGFITSASLTEQFVFNGGGIITGTDGEFTLTLVSPASLGSGYFNSSVLFALCYDQACTQQVTGSPVTVPIYYTVTLTEGKEYTLASVNDASISDLAYDSANQQLYVSGLGGYNSSFSGAITQVDPGSGAIGTQQALNDSLTHVAASSDGSLLFVASATNPVIYRLALPALTSSLNIALGTASDGNANIAAQMAVAPGAAHTVAVALGEPQSIHTSGTEIFDDAVARTNMLAPLGFYAQPDSIAWSASASLLYAYRYSSEIPFDQEIDQVAVSSSGLSVSSSTNLTGGADPISQIRYAAGNVDDFGGYVYSGTTGALAGQYQLPAPQVAEPQQDEIIAMVPDAANGHAFLLVRNSQSSHLLLLTYDLSTFTLQSVIDLGLDAGPQPTDMILWGANGVAFNRNGLQMLAGTFVAQPSAATVKKASPARARLLTMQLASPAPIGRRQEPAAARTAEREQR